MRLLQKLKKNLQNQWTVKCRSGLNIDVSFELQSSKYFGMSNLLVGGGGGGCRYIFVLGVGVGMVSFCNLLGSNVNNHWSQG